MHKNRLLSVFVGAAALATFVNGCSSSDGGIDGTPAPLAGAAPISFGGATTGHGGTSSANQGGKTGSTAQGGSTSTNGSGGRGATAACNGIPVSESSAGANAGGEDGAKCTGIAHEAERIGVDMYIMMDRSSSMDNKTKDGTTRWEALHAAMQDFVTQASATDLRAGIAFFPFDSTGGDNQSNDVPNCQDDNYAVPKVEIDDVSTDGDALLQAMDDNQPAGFTPTPPALRGALAHAEDWQKENPGHATVVVLVTDGYPTTCPLPGDLSQVQDAAKAGLESPERIKTYVVGLGAVDNLSIVAQQGGSGTPYVVDPMKPDVSGQLVSALLNISASPSVCEYTLPPPPNKNETLDTDKVSMIYTPAVGGPEQIPRVSSLGACDSAPNGGWYYDNPADPKSIRVCPCTCTRLAAGSVSIEVGCTPIIQIE